MEIKIAHRMHQLSKDLEGAAVGNSFYTTLKHYKILARELLSITKRIKLLFRDKKLSNGMYECLISLKTVVTATEFMKNGHKLPLFSYIINTYQKLLDKKIDSNQTQVLKRIQNNQKQHFYRCLNFKPITSREQNYLKSSQINNDFTQIVKNEIKIHNPECVCCSEVLVRNMAITNANPYFPIVIGLNGKESDQINLEKYVCAVCNQGGGVIIIGAERKGDSLWPIGIKFKKPQDIQEKEKQILNNMAYIKPDFVYSFQRILVHTNFIDKEAVADQALRFCFRIVVFTPDPKKMHYIQIYNKGYHNLYESYKLDQNNQAVRLLSSQTQAGDQIGFYDEAIKWYYKNKNKQKVFSKRANSHRGIQCISPWDRYSLLFYDYYNANQMEIETSNTKQMEQQNQEYSHNDEPKFKYSFTSILAVGSKKKDRYIKDLRIHMKAKKMLFELDKPFLNSFKDGSRSIWMLSHNDKHDVIKNCIKDFDNTGSITMIPVYKTLQIDRSRLTPQQGQQIYQRFLQRYPEGYKVSQMELEQENGLVKHPVLMSFDCYTHAIYAYMIFESMQLRPYFVKENTTYKKKPKIKSE